MHVVAEPLMFLFVRGFHTLVTTLVYLLPLNSCLFRFPRKLP